MKEKSRVRNVAIALGAFIFWGNLVSLMLPVENYAAVAKTVDFATVVFLLAGLFTAVADLRKRYVSPKKENNAR